MRSDSPVKLGALERRPGDADSENMLQRAALGLGGVISAVFCLFYAGWAISVVVLAVTGEWAKAASASVSCWR